MSRVRTVRPIAWITLCCVLFALAPGICAAAKKEARGEEFVFELPFPSPPWVADKVSWPATILVIRAEKGNVSKGMRSVKVIPRVANGSYSDLKVTVAMSLLDGEGNVVAGETETDGLEEEELTPFSFRLKIPEEQAQTIETCRVTIKAQPN